MTLKSIPFSVLMDKGDTEYLTRTPGAATSTTVWTLSVWFKRAQNVSESDVDTIWSAGTGASDYTSLAFETNDRIRFRHVVGGSDTVDLVTRALFLDPTGWSHLVVRYDSTEVTDTDRVRIWVNNIQLVDFATTTWPGPSAVTDLLSTQGHEIGREAGTASNLFDGYLSNFYLCDGQALSPTDFAEQNADAAAWQPVIATPTYGAEGFLLEFDTGADLGDDTSGNVNDWTEVVLDSSNQRADSPSQNSITFNQHYFGTSDTVTLPTGSTRLRAANTAYITAGATAALPNTGKWYWEYRWSSGSTAVDKIVVGIMLQNANINDKIGNDNYGWGLYNPSGTVIAVRHDAGDTNFTDTAAFAVTDYFSVAYDADTGNLWFGREGSWLDSGDPELGLLPHVTLTDADRFGGAIIPAASVLTASNTLEFISVGAHFDAPPNGYKTLRTDNWPQPSILKPNDYFDTISYAGDSSNPRSLTGLNFQPGFAWVKSTDQDSPHILTNTVVGGGVIWENNDTFADQPSHAAGDIAALTSDGITVDRVVTDADVNATGSEYVGLFWKEDPVAGFDVVGYAGIASPQAVSHSLGAVPDVMYVRHRNTASAHQVAYHGKRLDSGSAPVTDPETDYLEWSTGIAVTDASGQWNDVAPTDTDFTVGSSTPTNSDGADHMAMLWAEVEGFSKFTSYVGTGGDDEESPFIYCGFRPKVVFIKRTDSGANWLMILPDTALAPDSAFDGGTSATRYFRADATDAMISPPGNIAQVCASGLKVASGFSGINGTGAEYLVMAFAEAPFSLVSAFSLEKTGAGAMDLNFVLEGQGRDPHQHGDGAVDLNFLTTGNASGGTGHFGDGSPAFGLEISATGSAPLTFPAFGDGATTFGLFEIEAQGFNLAIRGEPEIPQLTTDGLIVGSLPAFGTVILPQLQVAGTMPQAIVITGNPRLPVLQVTGEFATVSNAILPQLTTVGTILTGTTIRAPAILIPVLQTDAVGDSPIILTGQPILLPRLGVLATVAGGSLVVSGGVLTGSAVTLPALDANGFLLIPQEMAGFITLPVLDLDPLSYLAPGAIVTGSVTLPLLRLESILVNGVTLVGTVWAMNTETLETTNYLNFDFNSLVSFADQPYGVTSSGIFLLEGDDDDGTNIDARILTGISDRGDENLKEAAQMYMQYEGQAMMFQLYPDGQQRLREYRFERRSNSTGVIHARAKGSRGLRSRSWQMGLRNLSGGAFTLDKLGLLLRALTRNTRKN